MWVERIQYAVGQGGFHGAAIGTGPRTEFPKEPFFTYIYDCGSEQRSPLKSAIDRFSSHHGKVDALFISHLDNDHVNGLDQLLATTDVDTVYLPYVNDLCLVLDLLEIDSQLGLTGTLIEVALDPAGFFGRRGVRRVIRVGPGGATGPESPVPIEPTREPDLDRMDVRVKTDPEPKRISRGQDNERAELLTLETGATIFFGSPIGLFDWVLVPHVAPAPKENVTDFRQALRRTLGLKPGQPITTKRLLRALSSGTARKELKDAYEAIVAGGARRNHNRISMSLYSGPTGMGDHDIWRYQLSGPERRFVWGAWHYASSGAVGWLGTGDTTLKLSTVWEHFESTYTRYFGEVALLDLPHHGSRHNFRPELAHLPNLRHAVANAAEPSRHGHPHPVVFRELEALGIRTWTVSQEIRSELLETIWQDF